MELPSDEVLRRIVCRYARFHTAHGNAIGRPVLVQPTAAFFPDEFRVDLRSVDRLLRRLTTYAPIADGIPLELGIVAPEQAQRVGCGSAACCSLDDPQVPAHGVEETEEGYRVCISAGEVGHPSLLTASLARSVGAIVLCEAGDEIDPRGATEMAEVAAVACGFGVLLANGAAVWGKSCGGLRMARATALSVEELAVALAIFASLHALKPSEVRANLEPTQREAFDLAVAWVESNPLLFDDLRHRPALLEGGLFDIEPVRGAFGRWRLRRKLERELRAKPAAAIAPRSDEQRRRLEEARALIDEVLPPFGHDAGADAQE